MQANFKKICFSLVKLRWRGLPTGVVSATHRRHGDPATEKHHNHHEHG
ncbi:hypothetical protein L842_6118 [Mycobacterium intracellulare MIN_052511_1280]|nr:hypothetical protein L842_6118 [Mycobacterium intracellulare MIN_052511_1280]